ncbi:hypothetical protein K1T71_013765 [Dendrolimus kikuchii]|uniref:Uncharacterized protein n=1 Tax=Dendrolimus kikuchii TaxID=765133 RepID=A0ACC1CHC0_9NEOP|nr:hypothetical protein K1T71_013765 [Dendrolimus kikuchii]
MFRTPRKPKDPQETRNQEASSGDEGDFQSPNMASPTTPKSRRSSGEWKTLKKGTGKTSEREKQDPFGRNVTLRYSPPPPPKKVTTAVGAGTAAKPLGNLNKTYSKLEEKASTSKTSATQIAAIEDLTTPPKAGKYKSQAMEAKAFYNKINEHLGNSRNLKTEIKQGVQTAVDGLYHLCEELIKELDSVKDNGVTKGKENGRETIKIDTGAEAQIDPDAHRSEVAREKDELMRKLEEHAALMRDNTMRIRDLQGELDRHREELKESRKIKYQKNKQINKKEKGNKKEIDKNKIKKKMKE